MVQDINNEMDGLITSGGGLSPEAYEKRCKEKLRHDLGRAEWRQGPLEMGREWVERVEDRYSEAIALSWVSFAKHYVLSCCSWQLFVPVMVMLVLNHDSADNGSIRYRKTLNTPTLTKVS